MLFESDSIYCGSCFDKYLQNHLNMKKRLSLAVLRKGVVKALSVRAPMYLCMVLGLGVLSACAAPPAPSLPSSPVTEAGTAALAQPVLRTAVLPEAPASTAKNAQPPLTPLADDYKITPNDLLEIEVFGVSELKRTVRVNTSGQVAMPLIGTLSVAGLTPADAEALIAMHYARNYLQDPQVSIFVKEFTTQRITLDGALVKPGIYPLSGQITLLRALALAGGGSQLADLEQVMLFRLTPEGESVVEKYDVMKIRAGEAADPMLQSDDVVVVNRNSKRAVLRDSLFRDIIDTLNPFANTYRNAVAP